MTFPLAITCHVENFNSFFSTLISILYVLHIDDALTIYISCIFAATNIKYFIDMKNILSFLKIAFRGFLTFLPFTKYLFARWKSLKFSQKLNILTTIVYTLLVAIVCYMCYSLYVSL